MNRNYLGLRHSWPRRKKPSHLLNHGLCANHILCYTRCWEHTRRSSPTPEKGALPEMEEAVGARIVDWLWDTPATFLPVNEDDSDQDKPIQATARCHKGVSDKLKTATTHTLRAHLNYAIGRWLITMMAKGFRHIRTLMLCHLWELMEDEEWCGGLAVRNYHATWLQHIEQGWMALDDEDQKMKLCRALAWHRLGPFKASTNPSQGPINSLGSFPPIQQSGEPSSVSLPSLGTKRAPASIITRASLVMQVIKKS